MAGDHAQIESEKWRRAALQTYYLFVGAVGIFLLFLFPPHFDLRPATMLSVAFAGLFLAVTERPTQSAGRSFAPLTAVVAASAVVFGYWTIALVFLSFGAVRIRMRGEESPAKELLSGAYFGQAGAGIVAVYAMVSIWSVVQAIESNAAAWVVPLISFIGVLAVGIVWQVVQHGFVFVAYALLGKSVSSLQFLRIGVIASIYGYLLIAMYSFGGLLAAALFYLLVAQTRIVQDLIGVTRSLRNLEHAQGQARSLIRELVRFTDVPGVQFTGEVENISQMLARHMGLGRKEVQDVGLAAELHEIGKCRLPARLRYGHSLNASEEAQRRTYARHGAVMLRNADALVQQEIADYIEFHTEHFDGTGYPKGLSGEAIPLASRILAIARGYVCMLTGYNGTPRVDKEEALRALYRDSGTLYDPRLVDLLRELVS